MRRAPLLVAMGLVVVTACTNDSDPTGAATSDASKDFCVAFVEAFMVHGPLEAAEFGRQLDRGEGPEIEDNPYESAPFQRFVASAPADLRDDIELLTHLPPDPTPAWQAAARRVDERVAAECHIGEAATSPLSAECSEQAVQLQRGARDGSADAGDFERFGSECAPDANPYETLPELCQGVVYSLFAAVETDVFRAGAQGPDEQEAALYANECGLHRS